VRPETQRPRPKVAIIDDEEDIITFLRLALADHGCDVVCTSSASRAMDLLVETSPDLVLLDLLMPEQTGVSLYSKIVHHPLMRQRPIVIMSGLGERAEISEIIGQAGDVPPPAAILEKPIELDALMATVNAQLFGDGPREAVVAGAPSATGGGT